MPIDPSIPLSVRNPQINSPLQSLGQIMALKNGMAEQEIRRQQIDLQRQRIEAENKKAQVEEDQRLKDQSDDNTLQELMKDPERGAKIAAGDLSELQGKIQPHKLFALQETTSKIHKEKAAAAEQDLKLEAAGLSQIVDTVVGLDSLPDIAAINAALPQAVSALTASGAIKAAGIDPTNIPRSVSSKDELKAWMAGARIAGAVNAKALALKKDQASIDASASQKAAADALTQGRLLENTGTKPISLEKKAEIEATNKRAAIDDTRADKTLNERVRHDLAMENKSTAEGGGKALPQTAIKSLDTAKSNVDQLERLNDTFDDKFSGIASGLENIAGRYGGESVGITTKGQTQWWADYQAYINNVRHGLFGGALTATEKEEFLKQSVTPSMDAQQIRDNLKRQHDISKSALSRSARVYKAGGYSPEQIKEYVADEEQSTSGDSGTFKVTDPRGKVHTFKTKSSADAFKAEAGIK